MNNDLRKWVLAEIVSLIDDSYDPDFRNRLVQIIYRLNVEGEENEQSES